MKKILLPFLILMAGFLASIQTISASSHLEISNTADFSHLSRDFSGGQIIFVRMAFSLPSASQSVLILRDSTYNLVNSFQLNKEGNYFSAIIPTPYEEGYYSLEAKIEAKDVNITGLETIKVGNLDKGDAPIYEDDSRQIKRIEINEENEGIETIKKDESDNVVLGISTGSFGHYMFNVFREVFRFIWPFS